MYWITRDGKNKLGPYTQQAMEDMVDSGLLRPTDMVLPAGGNRWIMADQFEWFRFKGNPFPLSHQFAYAAGMIMICVIGFIGRTILSKALGIDPTIQIDSPYGTIYAESQSLAREQLLYSILGIAILAATLILSIVWFFCLSSRAK